MIDDEAGEFLRARLTPRALAAWAGTDRLSALPLSVPQERALTKAGALLELFVGGGLVRRDPSWPDFGELVVERDGDLRATVSVLPLGKGLIVCDRLDTSDGLDYVCWPDDSSYHLAHAIPPGRRARWLDLGCGSACAEVMRPELATSIVAADLNARATRYAAMGLELSGISHAEVVTADLATGLDGPFELVTCNAPIPGNSASEGIDSRWRSTDGGFFARLFDDAKRVVSGDGMVVVHGATEALQAEVMGLPGERVVVSYTPEDLFGFGVLWWRPGAADRLVWKRRELTADRPHITFDDRLAVL
ncbi:MAG TPA: methyltransferase [Kofleriaceae bacterium]|nr:methyltransferase [Kofleriaceae bacterium]